jgi:hypothetical protein
MFRYGGPIKEGVMHGMKNGGPTGTGLVGDERYPKTGGREHHGFFLPALYGAGAAALRFLPSIYRGIKAGKYVKGWRPTAKFRQPATPTNQVISGKYSPAPLTKKEMFTSPEIYGRAIRENPGTALTLGSLGGTGVSKLFGGSEPDPINIRTKPGVPGGGDPGMYYEAPPKTKSAAELAAEAKAARTKKLNKYLDTMGYDKAKKTAIGDALIDASAIVQQGTEEGGSLKHADWSKMINQAIQATSQRLKKPEQIREAVGLMMTKADIQKDMNADEKALAKLLTSKKIDKLNKELEGNSFRENLIAITQKIPGQAGFDSAAQVTEGVDFKGNLITDTDWAESLKKMQEDPASTGLNEKQLIKLYTEKTIAGKGYEDGDYTVGNNLVTIKDDIVVAVE